MCVRTTRRDSIGLPTISRYDLLLAVLPIPLLCGAFASILAVLSETITMGVGGFVSGLLLGYAITAAAPTATGQSV